MIYYPTFATLMVAAMMQHTTQHIDTNVPVINRNNILRVVISILVADNISGLHVPGVETLP